MNITIFKPETGTSPQDCIVASEKRINEKSGNTKEWHKLFIKKFVDTQLKNSHWNEN